MYEPKVSVCIPTFNRAQYLRTAVESVLAQEFADFELLVVDNASGDETPDVVRDFHDSRIKYFRNPTNIGMTANLNECLTLAGSEYIVIFHDDDLMKPDMLRKDVAILDSYPQAVFVHAQAEAIDADGRRVGCSPQLWPFLTPGPEFVRRCWLQRHTVFFPTVMMRRSVVQRVGRFDPEFVAMCDVDFWQRLAAEGSVAFLRDVLLSYRIHDRALTAVVTRNGSEMLQEGLKYARASQALGYRLGLDLEAVIAKGWARKICVQMINLRSAGGSRRDLLCYSRNAFRLHKAVAREPRFWLTIALTLLPTKATPLVRAFRWRLLLALRRSWNAAAGLLQRRPQQDG